MMMMNTKIDILFFSILCFLLTTSCDSWGWFSEEKNPSSSSSSSRTSQISGQKFAGEFSIDPLNTQKGSQLVENAMQKSQSGSCWQNAYQNLFTGCREILADDEKQSRFAWLLSDCFQKDSGMLSFPNCDLKSNMKKCRSKLDEEQSRVYLQFFLQTNVLCHQLQAHAFKQQTEKLVNDLKESAQFAEDKLISIEEKSENLIQSSSQIHDSLYSIKEQSQLISKVSVEVFTTVDNVLKHTEGVHEQSKRIEASQELIKYGQDELRKKIDDDMDRIREAHDSLGVEISNLNNEAIEIEKEIEKLGDSLSLKMGTLQIKAESIEFATGTSLDKLKELQDGQSVALEDVQFLSKFLSNALEESRGTLQKLAEFGNRQQEELLQRQDHLQEGHERLVENSRTILAAQEAFESKQASMFMVLDKLFTVHNAMLVESRLIKAFVLYFLAIFIVYMFTSTKQTYNIRPRLYMGLCLAFSIEFAVLRYATGRIEDQAWIISSIRTLFVTLSSIQLLYVVFTYRDYEVLNHHILLNLMDKINNNVGMREQKEISYDSDEDWNYAINKEYNEEEEDELNDPDFILEKEEVDENSVSTTSLTRRYNLRCRSHRSYV
ncbi:protein GAMETE EXPRESSED 1-like [Impatiens glandulifera]|uniref:protein GAMETE EXPRESSED 1-like n=1 Tax=Impatiens glandulifera TaxID=253017 RepID=UPI001FB0ED9D|nr:protein GAMETE EXPRESSED 1-like [Impatiens glandulifera]